MLYHVDTCSESDCSVCYNYDLRGFKKNTPECIYALTLFLVSPSLTIHTSPACRLALTSPCSSNFLSVSSSLNQCPIPSSFPSSPSQSSLSQPTKLSGGVPPSPSHGKARSNKRKSMFGGSVSDSTSYMYLFCLCTHNIDVRLPII